MKTGKNIEQNWVALFPPGTIFLCGEGNGAVKYKLLSVAEANAFARVMSNKKRRVAFANGAAFETDTIKDVTISRMTIPDEIVEIGSWEVPIEAKARTEEEE